MSDKRIKSVFYPFGIDSGLGSLATETDLEAHVQQLIRQVLLTAPGERINRPDFGCGLRQMIFAPNSTDTANFTQLTVFQALEKWLGSLISVEEVKVNASQEKLEVQIRYTLKTSGQSRYLNVEVSL